MPLETSRAHPSTWTRGCGLGPARHHPRAGQGGVAAQASISSDTDRGCALLTASALGALGDQARWNWTTTPSICGENMPCGAAASRGAQATETRTPWGSPRDPFIQLSTIPTNGRLQGCPKVEVTAGRVPTLRKGRGLRAGGTEGEYPPQAAQRRSTANYLLTTP